MISRIFAILFILNIFFASGLVVNVFSATIPVPPPPVSQGDFIPCNGIDDCTFDKLFSLDNETDSVAVRIINYAVFTLAVPLATIAIVYGGILIATSQQNPGKRDEGKKVLQIAITGLVLTMAAYLIVKLIVNSLAESKFMLQ